jgi:hypothetical protein
MARSSTLDQEITMVMPRCTKHLVLVASTALLAAGLVAPAANADDTSGADVTGVASATTSVKRSQPNGKTDVIKVMGNVKWGDIELKK